MNKKLCMLLASSLLCTGTALAQMKVTGTVISESDGQPVIGASVKVNGTTIGAVTDGGGRFSLTCPDDKKMLTISYIGMENVEVAARPNMRIILSDNREIDEVIVVAYGTQKRSSFTGAAATVKGEKIEKLQVSNLSKAFEGSVAGVQTTATSGTPGSSAKIRIRGIGSISSSQEPLIVVDGVPYEGSLNSIPAMDVENITVLKDAAANSMYGARGSNGVILVTTKGSKAGKAKINFDGRIGFNTRGVPTYDIITNPGEYYEMMYESYRNSLLGSMSMADANAYAAQNLISKNLKYNAYKGIADNQIIDPLTGKLNPNARDLKWNDDWSKDPFDNGLRQEYNVNVQGGNENTQAYASLGYLSDEGYMVGSKFERISARVKIDQKINDNVKIGGNFFYANTIQDRFGDEEANYSNIFQFSQMIAPIYPIYMYDADGNRIKDANGKDRYDFGTENQRPYGSEQNPLAVAKENKNQVYRDNFSSRGYFQWNFLKDFKLTVNAAYDLFNTYENIYNTPIGGDAANVGGRSYKYNTRYAALNLNQLLDWNHAIGDHGVHVLLGHETKNDQEKYMYGHMTGFADPNNSEFNNASTYQGLNSYTNEYALEGFFAKGEYDYKDRYYFTASIRRDGSSKFHKDNRWGNFWAVGGAWRLSEETWMKDIDFIDNLKVKASYGTQGNDNILDSYGYTIWRAYSDLYAVNRVNNQPAYEKVMRGNPDLTWEKSQNFNVGFEASLLRRLNVNFDFFIKKTNDMIYASPIPMSEGSPSSIYRNEMDMKNIGVEFEADYDIIKTKDIKWNVALNLTHYKNKLTKLPASKPASEYPDGYQAGSYWRKIGGSLYDWYTYEYVGVDPETGLPLYNKYTTDDKGNEVISTVNKTSEATLRQTGKSAIPDLTGGISTSIEAYGFDLSVQTAFQIGGWVRDSFYAGLMNAGDQGNNFHKDMFNRWTPANTDTNIPMLNWQSQDASIDSASDFFLTKASYFSLRNVTLGYTLPRTLVRQWGIENLRFYVTGDNIWLLSKRKGLDPRQNFSGATGYVYSALSSYSFGVSLSF